MIAHKDGGRSYLKDQTFSAFPAFYCYQSTHDKEIPEISLAGGFKCTKWNTAGGGLL
jgi:hypothetical protein